MRTEFPNPVKREARERAGGFCECARLKGIAGFTGEPCGVHLGPGNTFYEHIICDGINGEPTVANCAVLVKTCWKRKTAWDQPTVAQAKRREDRNSGIERSRRGQPMPGSKASGWRKPFNRRAERRPP